MADKIIKTESIEINLYAVRSKDGKWLRSKGQNGYGNSWVDKFADAKVWNKPRSAKAQITYWANNYPQYGVPDLVEIVSGVINYIDYSEAARKSKERKEAQEKRRKISDLEYKINNYLRRQKVDQDYVEQLKEELRKVKSQ